MNTRRHITFGTYGTRLHGGDLPTVDREHNVRGTPFVGFNQSREVFERDLLCSDPVELTVDQRLHIEQMVPEVCERGGWVYIAAAAQPDHIHVLLSAEPAIDGKAIRKWLKRWLGESLSARWTRDGSWWAECGSTKAVGDDEYEQNVHRYIRKQRKSE